EASGLPQVQQQQPSYSQTGWRWMNQRVVHPQGVHPRDILPPYNTVPCQQRSLFAPQQESSSQIEHREMPH
ncbi:hypothetical protein MKW94_009820, partial [Papaver nudicaule]|nr:hypothetical protein [Papaver nudicaule]